MFRERARTLRAMLLSIDAVCITVAFGAALVLRVFHHQIAGLRACCPLEARGTSKGFSEPTRSPA